MSLSEEQLAARRRGISATDVAAILGVDPWRGPYSVWLDKMGQGKRAEGLLLEAGNALEPVIASEYARNNPGWILTQGTTVTSPKDARLIATPDYVLSRPGAPAPERLLEIKCAFSPSSAAKWGTPETDQVPSTYLLQVQWQLGVTGLLAADVARFYSGRVEYWIVPADPELFSYLVGLCTEWWDRHVVTEQAPEPSGADLGRVYASLPPRETEDLRPATPEESEALTAWRECYAEIKALEAKASDLEARVVAAIGAGGGLEAPDGTRVKLGAAGKPKTSTDWRAVAQELGAGADLLARHTSEGKPGRRRVWASWWRE